MPKIIFFFISYALLIASPANANMQAHQLSSSPIEEVSLAGWQLEIIQRAVLEFVEQTGVHPKNHKISLNRWGENFLVSFLDPNRNPNIIGASSNPKFPEMEIEVSAGLKILNSNYVR